MKQVTSFKKTLSIFLLSGLLAGTGIVSALTVSPARAEIAGDPGETVNGDFLIINEGDKDQTYYTSVENFESQGESGTPNFVSSKDGLASWVNVQKEVVIKKGERIKIPYSVTIPQNADAGGHFAAIFLSTVPPSAGDGQVSVGAKVGMLVLLRVTGNIKEEGGLLSFTMKTEKKVISSIPIDFVFRFSNKGNDRVKPVGAITIKNMFGGEVAKLDANKSEGNVLPNAVRRFDIRYGEGLEAPAVSAPFFDHVRFQTHHFALGMYTATIDLTFGNNGKATLPLTYFVLPWQLLSIVLGGAIVVILLLVLLLKQYNKWIIKQARAAAGK